MLNHMFQGIFAAEGAAVIAVPQFLLCVGVALGIGVVLALLYTLQRRGTTSFRVTLAILPAIVCVVIMMVNGNVGAGVAVAGAFSLVRFRSVPGTAREIGMLFLAMGTGLICGMGYLGYAVLFGVLMGLAETLLTWVVRRFSGRVPADKTLRVTVPEDLNYSDAFEELFRQYATRWELLSVKTSNMGSLFKLKYNITLRDPAQEKAFIDALRCRNGNLEINLMKREENTNAL